MSRDLHPNIWEVRQDLCKLRDARVKEAMEEYDTAVYLPALLRLQKECGEVGHRFTESRWVNGEIEVTCSECMKSKGFFPEDKHPL